MRRCLCCCIAECFRKINSLESKIRLKTSLSAEEMPSTLSQNIASAEGEPQPFLKAQKCLINLTLPIIFHFIMPRNLPTLPSSCPSDTASHTFGGRSLFESPENFDLTLISTPFNTHHCQMNPLRTVSVNLFSPADSAFQLHT